MSKTIDSNGEEMTDEEVQEALRALIDRKYFGRQSYYRVMLGIKSKSYICDVLATPRRRPFGAKILASLGLRTKRGAPRATYIRVKGSE